ncbi:MAG: hypothetical protein L6R37_007404 [Teloschistes peruensis]|nr:MAG: hypothetical protein L6R37_007404 [Teloschistes peruensis]
MASNNDPQKAWQTHTPKSLAHDKSYSLLTLPMVTILVGVGPDRKAYSVHNDLLCESSSHCRAELQGNVKKSFTKELTFPRAEKEFFEVFLMWIYGHAPKAPTNSSGLRRFVKILCFARSVWTEELNNYCVDQIRRYFLRFEKNQRSAPWQDIRLTVQQ